nr:enoyl-[acyl-carrier-protein] reductase, mitochondrial-like [Leptinotarsa decemlineata]XP_023025027.1 enoyl-[acyl-carrier-protein] reductase, mitochondrial-like [Leptinotarsa decemlineata]
MPSRLTFSEPGDPLVVLRMEEFSLPEPQQKEVLVEMKMAPINPVDINMIQGIYPIKIDVPGFEGVARVIKLGSCVEKLRLGDHVVPLSPIGTWRTHLVIPEKILFKVPKMMGYIEASTMIANPSTMYRLLKDFVSVQAGDTVIQNGANSSCGVFAIQLCRHWGINTVNIVRNRPNIEVLKTFLKSLGATYVFTEDEFAKIDIFKQGTLKRPLLALNCVGGRSATNLIRHLAFEGVMVTYGGMSMEPVSVSTSALISRGIRLEGFNLLPWSVNEKNNVERTKMYRDLISMILDGSLKMPPHVLVKFENYKDALIDVVSKGGMVGKKYLFDFRSYSSKI